MRMKCVCASASMIRGNFSTRIVFNLFAQFHFITFFWHVFILRVCHFRGRMHVRHFHRMRYVWNGLRLPTTNNSRCVLMSFFLSFFFLLCSLLSFPLKYFECNVKRISKWNKMAFQFARAFHVINVNLY